MDDSAALQASFWLMTFLQTMGSVDMPGSGDRKLPAPRAYLATIVIWSVLQVAADAGYGRAARNSAWLVVLVSLVFGPFGAKAVDLFNKVADMATGVDQPAQTASGPPAGPAGPIQAPRTRTGSPIRPVAQAPFHTAG